MAWNMRRPCIEPSNFMLMQPNGGRNNSGDALFSVLDSYSFPSLRGLPDSRASNYLGKRPYFSMFDHHDDDLDDRMLDCSSSQLHHGEKKRRLSIEQVRSLEKSFETENKLEPERKIKLAQELGLQPRQVAVWFQNRRARWKTKQLERDNDDLKESFDAVVTENQKLYAEVSRLKAELEAYKTNGSNDVVHNNIKSESDEQVETDQANEASQTVQSESVTEEVSKKLAKNFSTCSEVSTDHNTGDAGTPHEQASAGTERDNASGTSMGSYCINFAENTDSVTVNVYSQQQLFAQFGHVMKYCDPDASYEPFNTDLVFNVDETSYSSLWD